MSDFKVFDYLDKALVARESRDPRPSRSPSVWPSEASAIPFDQSIQKITGKCHRASYWRMVGKEVGQQIDKLGAMRFTMGRAVEGEMETLARQAGIWAASGVRTFIPDISLPIELDLILVDPVTKQGYIGENKSISSNPYAVKEIITNRTPKTDHCMQLGLYLLEVKTGKQLKKMIYDGVLDRLRDPAMAAKRRNRIEADLRMVDMMSDGPLKAKLLYETREGDHTTEFDLDVVENFDGLHYLEVDGGEKREFTVESIYERFRILQGFWHRSMDEAKTRLATRDKNPMQEPVNKGDEEMTPADLALEKKYFEELNKEVLALPNSFLPPAEYEFSWGAEKVELAYKKQIVSKSKYEGWKKGHKGKERIGDWQCAYCSYRNDCLVIENPAKAYLIQDIHAALDEEETGATK